MKTIFRTAALFTTFSLPLTSGCIKNENKPVEIKPVDINLKRAIDEKRAVIEKKEREFARELTIWAGSALPNVLIMLEKVSEDEGEILKCRDIAFKLIKRRDDFADLTGYDFSKNPNEEQLEAFTRLISMAEKGGLSTWRYNMMPIEDISKKIKEYIRKEKPELKGEEFKEWAEGYLDYFTVYRETSKNLRTQRDELFFLMQDFHEKAKEINEPLYNPIWGLDRSKLQEIPIFIYKDQKK